jgi:NTP pyrophosphatase (non-canonical NTP hydrolase)
MIDLSHISESLSKRTSEIFPQCKTWTNSDWFLELVGEVGEAGNIIKKINRQDTNRDELREKLKSEFADIFLCLLLNCNHHQIDLELATFEKFNLDSTNRSSTIQLDPNCIFKDFKLWGLDLLQIRALINFYRSSTGLDPIGLNLSPDRIIEGK